MPDFLLCFSITGVAGLQFCRFAILLISHFTRSQINFFPLFQRCSKDLCLFCAHRERWKQKTPSCLIRHRLWPIICIIVIAKRMLTNSFVKEVHYLLKAGPVFLLNSGDYGDEDAGICSPRSGAQASTWNLSSTHSPHLQLHPSPRNLPLLWILFTRLCQSNDLRKCFPLILWNPMQINKTILLPSQNLT